MTQASEIGQIGQIGDESVGSPAPPSPWAERMLSSIRWYQRQMEGRPSPCRFFPSCSAYAHEAIESHGAGRGLWLAIRRLVRCRPFGPSGFDPVPEPLAPPTSPTSRRG